MTENDMIDSAYALMRFIERGSVLHSSEKDVDEMFASCFKIEEYYSSLGTGKEGFVERLKNRAKSNGETWSGVNLSRLSDEVITKFIDPSVDDQSLARAVQSYVQHFSEDRFVGVVGTCMRRRKIWVELSKAMSQIADKDEIEADLLAATWEKRSDDEIKAKVREMLLDGVCDILVCVMMGPSTRLPTVVLNEMNSMIESLPELSTWPTLLRCQHSKACAKRFEPYLELLFKIIDSVHLQMDYNELLDIVFRLEPPCKIRKYLLKNCCNSSDKKFWRSLTNDINNRLSQASGH